MLTATAAVFPWVTAAGAVTLLTATSVVGGAFTMIPMPALLLLEFASASCCVANRVCPLIAAPAVFHGMATVALAPAAGPASCGERVDVSVVAVSLKTKYEPLGTYVGPSSC